MKKTFGDEEFEVIDLRKNPFFGTDNKIFEKYCPTIGVIGFALYVAYSYYTHNKGYCYPSQTTIANKLSISVPTIEKYNKILEKNKLIKIERKTGFNNRVYLLELSRGV